MSMLCKHDHKVVHLSSSYGDYGWHLYLADHGSMDRIDRSRGFTISRLRHISSIFAYHNERIYVYVFVYFVFVIYYDLQVHFHVTSYVDQYSLQHFSHGSPMQS